MVNRARRFEPKGATVLKWTARVAVAVAALVAVACIAVFWASQSRLSRTYAVRLTPLSIAGEVVTIEAGRQSVTRESLSRVPETFPVNIPR